MLDFNIQVNDNIVSLVPSGVTYIPDNRIVRVTIYSGLSGYMPGVGEFQTLQDNYEFWFTSKYCPLFTTIRRVKIEAGPQADEVIDDTIYRMIYKNSLDAVEIYNMAYASEYSSTNWGCTPSGVPYRLRRYVECKTAYDILSLMDQVSASAGGQQLKSLGDMTIKYGPSSSGAGSPTDPSKKKLLYACWNEQISNIRAIVAAVKGYYDESKGFLHPIRSLYRNRVIKPEDYFARRGSTPGSDTWRSL